MISLAVAVGLGTGVLASALIGVIAVVQRLAYGTHAPWPLVLLVPTVGALLVGLLVTYVAPETSGSGVIQVMTTIATLGGRFRGRVPFAGIAASGLALGAGASGGREGPIVLIGGSVGSLLGRLFAVGEERMRTLVAAGAAAGIGASFNAPIGGMLFAIELIIGRFRTSVLQSVVVASVVGSVTAHEIIGPGIIYEPATLYSFTDARELGLYGVLGVTAALFGIAFLHGEDLAKRLFTRLQIWRPLKLALGGFGVGLVALVVPEVLGTGDNLPPIDGIRDPIQRMLTQRSARATRRSACCCSLPSPSSSQPACRSAVAMRSARSRPRSSAAPRSAAQSGTWPRCCCPTRACSPAPSHSSAWQPCSPRRRVRP